MLNSPANTNPTREYTGIGPVWKGGFFYHKNNVPGFIGIGAKAEKEASVCNHSILYLVAWGNSSVEKAKERAGISKVAFVDYQQIGILSGFIYHKFCTLVKGE